VHKLKEHIRKRLKQKATVRTPIQWHRMQKTARNTPKRPLTRPVQKQQVHNKASMQTYRERMQMVHMQKVRKHRRIVSRTQQARMQKARMQQARMRIVRMPMPTLTRP
jgi:hypothetical protein